MPDESVIGAHSPDPAVPEQERAVDIWKRRDRKAHVLAFMVRCRSRMPGWHEDTLGVLAAAEAEGVRVLEAALPAIGDQKLRRIFLHHIEDERRHTKGFTDLFRELCPDRALPSPPRASISTNVLDFLAFLEITEVRGEQMIKNYHGLYAEYPNVHAFIATVLRDERYHANYLHLHLDNLARQGLTREVTAARRAAARIDARGFRSQVWAFILAIPSMLIHGLRPRGGSRPGGRT